MTVKLNEAVLVDKIRARFGDKVLETVVDRGDVTHTIVKDDLLSFCTYLKSEGDLQMSFLSDVIGLDLHPDAQSDGTRFELLYQMLSMNNTLRIRLKIRIAEDEHVPSVTELWQSADCAEREVYDMFGIIFDGHPNLRRIYLAEDWEGFPLRKDYPLKGYKDRYNPDGEERK
jgi:NADH-quinone oxidoreductase subunit C